MAKQKELEIAINNDAANKILELEEQANEEKEALRMEGAKMLLDLTKDSTQKELSYRDWETKNE